MKKIIGVGLILALFIPLVSTECFAEINKKWEPDFTWYSLIAANVLVCTWDLTMSLDAYRKHRPGLDPTGYAITERNPIAKYFFDNCPWGTPIYMIGGLGIIVATSYFINKLGLQPLGHIILGGLLLTEGYAIYINLQI